MTEYHVNSNGRTRLKQDIVREYDPLSYKAGKCKSAKISSVAALMGKNNFIEDSGVQELENTVGHKRMSTVVMCGMIHCCKWKNIRITVDGHVLRQSTNSQSA